MRRKLKCYMAYTTFLYRLLGVVLIPCAFWILCGLLLWSQYGGGGGEPGGGNPYGVFFTFSAYTVFYELFTDFWVLGGCLSDAGKGLRYFRTSRSGAGVMRDIISVDLARRFLYCMVFPGMFLLFTGWKMSLVRGLSTYCVLVGVLHGSRNCDGLQWSTGIGILAQIGVVLVSLVNIVLLDLAGDSGAIMLAFLAVLYGALALMLSSWMVRRITVRIQGKED